MISSDAEINKIEYIYSSSIEIQPAQEEIHNEPKVSVPFNLQWIYGLNENTPIINLNNETRNQVFFAASHNGILYDYIENKMKFVQCHESIITNIARDGSGKIIVTADSGADNCVNIWDSETLNLLKNILSPHGTHELKKLALSVDAKYLLTFGYEEEATIKLWNWSDERKDPIYMKYLDIPNKDVIAIIFNPIFSSEFCVALQRKIIIGYVDEEKNKISTQRCIVKASLLDYGNFECITYNTKRHQLLACTDIGYIAIFMSNGIPKRDSNYIPKEFVKIVRIERKCISVIKECDGYLVVCNTDGQIHIYDSDIKILFRFDDFNMGRVKALSFNMTLKNSEEGKSDLSTRLTSVKKKGEMQPYIQRDAYINTESEGIGLVDFVNNKFYKILPGFRQILVITVHPEKTLCCIGDVMGTISLIDYANKKIVTTESLPKNSNIDQQNVQITCMKFSYSGAFLVCGMDNGNVWLFDSMLLKPISKTPLDYSSTKIKQIEFSQDSSFMAYFNIAFIIFLLKYDCHTSKWSFIGKRKSHCGPIINIVFEMAEFLKLLTFGEDRIMNVYIVKLLENGETSFEKLKTVDIEKYATPKFVINDIWPQEKGLLVTICDDYKYKVFDYKTERILATYLAPKYPSPILKIIIIPSLSSTTEYSIFCTDKNIGIQKHPLDGNPYKHIGILGHPIKVINFILTPDGQYLFTSGEGDYGFLQWTIDTQSVEARAEEGGPGLNPYMALIEGGRTGWIFGQMKVLFYYAQILCQGDYTPYLRKISESIPTSTLPDILRAVGYYPTDFEINTLMNEVNYHIFDKTINNEVTFDEYVRLLVNYQPAFGNPFCKFRDAFKEFGERQRDGTVKLNKNTLITNLIKYGENGSENEIKKILEIFTARFLQKSKLEKLAQEEVDNFIPKIITMEFFFGDLLGFDWNEFKEK